MIRDFFQFEDGSFFGLRAEGKTYYTYKGTTIGLDGGMSKKDFASEADVESAANKDIGKNSKKAIIPSEQFWIDAVHDDILIYFFIPNGALEKVAAIARFDLFEISNSPTDFPFPRSFLTEAVCLSAVQWDGFQLQYIPKEALTQKLCEVAVQSFDHFDSRTSDLPIRYVSPQFITPEFARLAVTFDSAAIRYIPEKLRTEELCKAAIKSSTVYYTHPIRYYDNYNPLDYIPDAIKTAEFCLSLLDESTGKGRNGEQYHFSLGYIPEEFRTARICLDAVKLEARDLEYVPEKLKTGEMCRIAVEKDVTTIQFVPKNHITPELCMLAAQTDGGCLQHIPTEFRSSEICLAAVQNDKGEFGDHDVLKHVPEALRTPALCIAAITVNPYILESVPESSHSPEFYHAYIEASGKLYDVPEDVRTPEICLAAVRKSDALKYVPEDIRTPEICLTAVQREGFALQYVPEDIRAPEICLAAVQQSGSALKYVTEDLRTPEMCLAAIQQFGKALEHVPEKLKTAEICKIAVEQDGNAIEYVPENLITDEICRIAAKNCFFQQIPESHRTTEICLFVFKNMYAVISFASRLKDDAVYIFKLMPESIKTLEIWAQLLVAYKLDSDSDGKIPQSVMKKIPKEMHGEALRIAYKTALAENTLALEEAKKARDAAGTEER
jgi:hypothetical protein